MAWNKNVGAAAAAGAPKVSFASIMQEQVRDAATPNGLLPPVLGEVMGLDVSLTVPDTTTISSSSSTMADDLALAEALQQMEHDEAAFASSSRRSAQQDPNTRFSKVGVVSRYDTTTVFSHKASFQPTRSGPLSDAYTDARRKEAELLSLGLEQGDLRSGMACLPSGEFLTKHDAQLNGLANSSRLSELEGVGDLQGAGILVNNTVANEVRKFANKKKPGR